MVHLGRRAAIALVSAVATLAPLAMIEAAPATATAPSAAARAASPNLAVDPAATLAPGVTIAPAPDHYVPPMGLLFNHPFFTNRGQITTHVWRMIRSTEPGQSIRLAAFSVGVKRVVDALIAARNRGVRVQVIGDSHLVDPKDDLYSKGFVRLRRTIGRDRSQPSWVYVCDHSCRGNGGNLHMKMYLFSLVTNTPNVVVTGSANLTRLAVAGQWNHAKTVSDPQVYSQMNSLFDQLAADVPMAVPNIEWDNMMGHTWIFPFPTMTELTDPAVGVLNKVQCLSTNPDGTTRRTKLRFGMYTWSDERGIWLSSVVRNLWDQGCDIAIETSIMSRNVRARLTARYGRGPIPIRKVGTWDPLTKEILTYDHHKWFTIDGATIDNPNAQIVVSGSCNFTNLGKYSDEMTTVYESAPDVASYNADFAVIWREKHTFRLGPLRTISAQRAALSDYSDPVPGVGKLWRAEPD